MVDTLSFEPSVVDLWVFRRGPAGVEYLLLLASEVKAARHFGGGRFWQVPSGVVQDGESIPAAADRLLAPFGLTVTGVWQSELTYPIYNRRFHAVQLISVFAAETADSVVALDPEEHGEYGWFDFGAAQERVHYRGLKDGRRSTRDYVTGPAEPAAELRLR